MKERSDSEVPLFLLNLLELPLRIEVRSRLRQAVENYVEEYPQVLQSLVQVSNVLRMLAQPMIDAPLIFLAFYCWTGSTVLMFYHM